MSADDLWCPICDRGAEGCLHPIDEPPDLSPEHKEGDPWTTVTWL